MFFGSKPAILTDEKKIDEVLSRGVDEVIPDKEALKKALLSGKELRIKLGVDATGENLHVGHSVPLLKLRDFQQLGHKVVFIVGDFTALIGDTSDKESERPMLSPEQTEKNIHTWKAQVGKILDLSKAEFRKNSEWLNKLTYEEIGEHANLFSVADFIARDNIKRRLDSGKRVSLREVLYPLMQGYDSVAVKADVEIGGSDQRFNLLAGRTLQEKFGQTPQHILTFALMTDAAGKKISKTGAATVNFNDTADNMFGKVMSVPDELVEQYFISMTRVPLETVKELLAGHPKEAKMELATELVRMYHNDAAAQKAKENFESTFSKGEVPEDVEECAVGEGESLADALVRCKTVSSKSEFRRLQEGGAIKVAGSDEKVTDSETVESGTTLRVGKHRFIKVIK